MINVKSELAKALKNNAALTNLLGGKRIYPVTAPKPDQYPRIVYREVNNADVFFADDAAAGSTIDIEMSVLSTENNVDPMADQADETMKSLGFHRYFATTIFNPQTKVFEKLLRYRIDKTY